ncbi:C-type lectin domain family 2 member B [Saccopteryx bilineata]|uniref:C-type lectin domain family 2 member B n=1 Tax=Saccopteryx bilineata TaxID=59482 RepID=UPI00338F4C0E
MPQNTVSAALSEVLPGTNNNNQSTDSENNGIDKCKMSIILITLSELIVLLVLLVIQPSPTQYCCPDYWIGFQNNCYNFSKDEGDWNSSRKNCLTQHADLTVIDTKEEMDFLKLHKYNSDHWIGLQMTENQTGKWVNGNIFNKWFTVKGNEKCTYLSDDGTATARCYTERKWICRKKKNT